VHGIKGDYYYQAYRIIVHVPGTVIFTSTSSLKTAGYLYGESFDPLFPSYNLEASNFNYSGSGQFRIDVRLYSTDTYILVVTTYDHLITGSIIIEARGSAYTSFDPFTATTTTTSGWILIEVASWEMNVMILLRGNV
jgi:hypothetical protein